MYPNLGISNQAPPQNRDREEVGSNWSLSKIAATISTISVAIFVIAASAILVDITFAGALAVGCCFIAIFLTAVKYGNIADHYSSHHPRHHTYYSDPIIDHVNTPVYIGPRLESRHIFSPQQTFQQPQVRFQPRNMDVHQVGTQRGNQGTQQGTFPSQNPGRQQVQFQP